MRKDSRRRALSSCLLGERSFLPLFLSSSVVIAMGIRAFLTILISLICTPVGVPAQVVHPQPEKFPTSESVARVGGETIGEKVKSKLLRYETRLGSVQKIASIGEEDGEEHEVIGEVTSTIVHEGKLFLLDSEFEEVKVYDLEGSYIDSFGRAGSGPGEFVSPEDFDVDEEGRLWIADADRSVSIFAPTDSGYVDVSTFSVGANPKGFAWPVAAPTSTAQFRHRMKGSRSSRRFTSTRLRACASDPLAQPTSRSRRSSRRAYPRQLP